MFDSGPLSACLRIAAAPNHNVAQITAGPELEITNDTLAIIRWTTTNPGGTDLHYGIVHYGTDAMNLSQVAKSPNRRNLSHPDMIFRVRIAGLSPQTTYYYTVESTGASGCERRSIQSHKNLQNQVAPIPPSRMPWARA